MSTRPRGIQCLVVACMLGCWLSATAAQSSEPAGLTVVTEKPAITDEILLNPGMGLFFMPGTSGNYDGQWYLPIVAVAYFRVDWSMLEPEEGKYRFDEVLGRAFEYWLSRGKGVSLRVMSSNMHSQCEYVTPKWVFDAGVPAVVHKGLYVARQIDPPFWNSIYREKQAAFIAALGRKYNGMKGLEFVDIGSVGEWGESHLMRWSDDDRETSGYTPTVYTTAYLRFIDLHRRAFPNTPVALNCHTGGAGQSDVIADYAVSKGIWLRQDGLTPDYARNDASRYYHQYFRQVKTLFELRDGYRQMSQEGMSVLDTFQRGMEDPISYLNLMGAGEIAQLPEPDRQACRLAARGVGYRLAPVLVEHTDAIHVGGGVAPRFWARITWRNLGSAPCYEHLAVDLALVSAQGKEVFRTVEIPSMPTTLWLPKEDVVTALGFALPADLAAGRYTLKIGLVDPLHEDRHILLPLADKDPHGRYPLCTIAAAARTVPVPQPHIPGGTLDSPAALKAWWFPRGLTASLDGKTPEGKPCVRLAGKTERGWNYAGTPGVPLLPATEYVLTAKMNVTAIADPQRQPYVKVGLVDSQGKWFTNKNSGRYDTSRLGTWQQLRARFVTEPQTGGGHVAVEKGGLEPVEATILLGDIHLEAIGAP